jgi:hypothetical protein
MEMAHTAAMEWAPSRRSGIGGRRGPLLGLLKNAFSECTQTQTRIRSSCLSCEWSRPRFKKTGENRAAFKIKNLVDLVGELTHGNLVSYNFRVPPSAHGNQFGSVGLRLGHSTRARANRNRRRHH